MSKWTLAAILLVSIGSALLGREIFPKETTRVKLLPLPQTTDTLVEDSIVRDTVVHNNYDTIHTTDTLTLADTVWQTDTIRIVRLAPRWYIDTASFGSELEDSTYISTTWLAADSTGLYRRDGFERLVATPGPVERVSADAQGVNVDFGEWPEQNNCGFWCKAKLIGGTVGVTSGACLATHIGG